VGAGTGVSAGGKRVTVDEQWMMMRLWGLMDQMWEEIVRGIDEGV